MKGSCMSHMYYIIAGCWCVVFIKQQYECGGLKRTDHMTFGKMDVIRHQGDHKSAEADQVNRYHLKMIIR